MAPLPLNPYLPLPHKDNNEKLFSNILMYMQVRPGNP